MTMPVRRIAIVNRGDAASRCLRAIRELRAERGLALTAIALYTEPDRAAPFVREADEALSLGAARRGPRGAPPRLAYLDRARVLAALRATRADSVWPGWGFLAEDAAFVEQLEQRDLVFIGPSSRAMRALGDKIGAKRLAQSCAVPVAAWSDGPVTQETVEAAARRLGLPLLIKAAAAGGGRGIRLVERWDDIAGAFARASAEATQAFGDPTVFLETLVPRARHIEVQIAADQQGTCRALGLRDCSVQRRHQKVIEEAPPPGLDAALDQALRDAACRLAAAAGYTGVATVEFLLAADGGTFFFLEVNPRLQVEHGLTEMLTGLDLVKLQLDLARGEPLPATPTTQRGHAIEARICAEDPAADFAPAPGTIVLFDLPGGPGVRVDSGVALGTVLPAEFDPLIAKVMAHAPTRAAALARLACALDELRLVIDGGASNKGLLLDLLGSDALRGGGVDVEWLDRILPALPPPAHGAQALIAAAILVYQEERATARLNFFAEAMSGAPRTIPDSGGLSVELAHRGAAYRVHVLAIGDWTYRIALDGRECVARLLEAEPHACQLVIGGDRYRVTVARTDGGMRLEVNGRPHLIGRDTGGMVRAAAPAVVIALDVAVGDRVEAGQRLGLLETMKVEVAFHAPFAGTVAALPVRCNERIAAGAVLAHIQPAGRRANATGDAPRLVLPDWDDALLPLFDDTGRRDLRAAAAAASPDRQRGLGAFGAAVRRVLLGYDQRPDIDAQLRAVLEAPLPDGLDAGFLSELAEVRDAIGVFADTEVLFSRQPEPAAGGAAAPSNDAWLRLYLRRTRTRGAGLPERFLGLLRRALQHYGCAELDPGEKLERALLRLFAAQARGSERYRLVGDLLRFVTGLAAAGVDLSDDSALAGALGTCIALRGTVPDALADAGRRGALHDLRASRHPAAGGRAPRRNSNGPSPRSHGRVRGASTCRRWRASPTVRRRSSNASPHGSRTAMRPGARSRCRHCCCAQYAPRVPAGTGAASAWLARPAPDAAQAAHCRLDYGPYGVVCAGLATARAIAPAWDSLCDAAAAEAAPSLLELFVTGDEPITSAALQALVESLMRRRPPRARRVCCTALHPDGSRVHVTYLDDGDGPARRDDCFGLHPETARRLDLDRLAEFELERLPGTDGVYAFHGRSRRIPSDERLFILADVRAALPGVAGNLYEPAFVHAFGEAVRRCAAIRSERDQWRRLHWNRITLVVRPSLYLGAPGAADAAAIRRSPRRSAA